MNGVTGAAASQVALSQAQVRSEVALRVLRMARESDRQVLELIEQAVQSTTETAATSEARGRIDTYG
jgi:hypothetical protein